MTGIKGLNPNLRYYTVGRKIFSEFWGFMFVVNIILSEIYLLHHAVTTSVTEKFSFQLCLRKKKSP